MKFGHIGIKVTDKENTLDFYENILECKVLKDYNYPDKRLVFLDGNGTIIELIYKDENEVKDPGPIEHIAFKVDSLEEKMKVLDKFNIKYSEPRIVGKAKIIFFEGPNKEEFEFVQRIKE
jgi:catechol 2,3-dioxygenase-like lactoylglutathione lyase family enzyme